MISKPNDSNLWKALAKVWDTFLNNIIWKLEGGGRVNFLMDHWTPTEQPFFFKLAKIDMIMDTTMMVKDMVNVVWGVYRQQFFVGNTYKYLSSYQKKVETNID